MKLLLEIVASGGIGAFYAGILLGAIPIEIVLALGAVAAGVLVWQGIAGRKRQHG